MTFYLRPLPAGQDATAYVKVPSYRAVPVSRRRRPLSDWPKAQRITLNRLDRDDATLYQMDIPERHWPESGTREVSRPEQVLQGGKAAKAVADGHAQKKPDEVKRLPHYKNPR